MALPVTITGKKAANQNSYHGPFKSSGGAFYTILKFASSTLSPVAYKATDPTDSFSEQDGANRPTFGATGSIDVMNAFQDGDLLHVAVQLGVGDEVWYARFDMATDTWGDLDSGAPVDRDILVDGAPDGARDACDVCVLSTGKIRIVYQGERDKVMGTPYHRIDHAHSTDGFTWTTAIAVNANNDEINYEGPRIVLPPSNSDQAHIVYGDGTNLLQRAISSGDTLRTERDTGFDVTTDDYPITRSVGFIRSSTSKVRIGYLEITTNDLEILEFDAFSDDTDPTETSSNVSTDDVRALGKSINACLAVDGSTVHAMLVKAADGDLYSADDGGSDTWTTPVSTFTGTINHVSCNIYDRSGTKLAHIIDDGGTIKYDEDDLGAGATTVTVTASLEAAIQQQLTLAASLDAGVQTERLLTTTADAAIAAAITGTVDLQAVIAAVQSAQASLEAALRATADRQASLDGAVATGQAATGDLDAVLAAVASLQSSLDAVLRAARSADASLDGVVQSAKSTAASLDAVVEAARTLSVAMDAALTQALTVTAGLDAFISGAVQLSVGLDAALRKLFGVASALDAVLSAAQGATASLDAAIARVGAVATSLEAALQATASASAGTDAVVQKRLVASAVLAAVLQRAYSAEASLDAYLVAGLQIALSIDAVLQRVALIVTVGMDGALRDGFARSAALDAVLGSGFTPSGVRTHAVPGGRDSIVGSGRRTVVVPPGRRVH